MVHSGPHFIKAYIYTVFRIMFTESWVYQSFPTLSFSVPAYECRVEGKLLSKMKISKRSA